MKTKRMEDETLKYIAMNIETSSAGIEALITSLMEVGITDVVVEDPRDFEELMDKKQSYDWDYVDEELVASMEGKNSIEIRFFLLDLLGIS